MKIEVTHPLSLLRLYDDAPAFLDFHVQGVGIHQSHAYEGGSVRLVGFDNSRLSVPDHRDAVHIEGFLHPIGKNHPDRDSERGVPIPRR